MTTLIVNLLGQPKAIAETLEGLKSEAGKEFIPDIFATEPYFVDLIGWLCIDARAEVCKISGPKSALGWLIGRLKL